MGRDAIVEWRTPDSAAGGREFVTLSSLRKRADAERVLPVARLIFHCGRCGSTLLGRLLEADRSNRVLLEPNALQRFIEINRDTLDRPEVQRDLRTLAAGYGLDPSPQEERLVIKLTSTSILHVRQLRACFPMAQCLYLLRDPTEVVASELRGLAAFLRREQRPALAALFGGDPVAGEYSDAEWCAWYVERNLREARRFAGEFERVIDYVDHRSAYLDVLNAGLVAKRGATDPEIAAVLGSYSKDPGVVYSATEDARKVPVGLRAVVESITREAYGWWRERLATRAAQTTRSRTDAEVSCDGLSDEINGGVRCHEGPEETMQAHAERHRGMKEDTEGSKDPEARRGQDDAYGK